MKRECGCPAQQGPLAELFGPDLSTCKDHAETYSLYRAAFHAMAGNVYAMAQLAEAGLCPGVRPTLKDFDRAGQILFARLSPEQRAADLAELEA